MLIECDQVSVHLGKQKVLSNISLGVDAGEIITILGPNGSGKTTLFKALIGALKPSAGFIHKKPGLGIGYVPQTLHIDETLPLTVKRFMNLPNKHSLTSIDIALNHAGLPDIGEQQMMDLSGGQFQRVLLARALLSSPDLLLLDEATQGLDHRGSADFYRHIIALREQLGCAIVMISHDLHVVMRKTDRVICLNGHICCEGKPETVGNSAAYQALFGLDKDSESALYLHRHHNHDDHPDHHHHLPQSR